MRLVAAFDGGGVMISVLLSALSALCSVGQSTATKLASKKSENVSPMSFNAAKLGAALILFALMCARGFAFHIPTAVFALIYAAALFFSTLFGYLALANGSMVLSSLIASYSVLIPCLYGIIGLNEKAGAVKILGIVLLLISMRLLVKQSEKAVISKKWTLYVSVTFLCNGLCSVVQKKHQTAYPGEYLAEFMFFAVLACFLLFLLSSVFLKCGYDKKTSKYAAFAGILMGLANFLTLFLSAGVGASVLFPVVTMFTVILNTSISRLVFKDKLSRTQLVGILAGAISVIMIK